MYDLDKLVAEARDLFESQQAMRDEGSVARMAAIVREAYAAGVAQSASDLDRAGRKIQKLERENTERNSKLNQAVLGRILK